MGPPSGLEGVPVFIGTSDVDEWVPLVRVDQTAAVFSAAGPSLDYRVFEGRAHDISDEEQKAAPRAHPPSGLPRPSLTAEEVLDNDLSR